MKVLSDSTELEQLRQGATLVMFGGADCSVCSAVKPKIEAMLLEEFPKLTGVYVDCQDDSHALCEQEGIFSIPVVQVWFEGRKYAEFVRVFAMGAVRDAIAKPYDLIFEES